MIKSPVRVVEAVEDLRLYGVEVLELVQRLHLLVIQDGRHQRLQVQQF